MAAAALAADRVRALRGSAIAGFVGQQLGGRSLEALPTMMVCAVQRLRDGAAIGFSRGQAGLAVQAATAIEGRLAPVRVHGELYADADLRMPLSLRLARARRAARAGR